MAAKETPKTKKAKPRSPKVKKSVAEQAQTNGELRRQLAADLKELEDRDQQHAQSLRHQKATAIELQDCERQLIEAVEHQTATSEILCVIASSPTDIQPVLDTIAENAARLCEATDAAINLREGGVTRRAAQFGSMPSTASLGEPLRDTRGTPPGRALVDGKTVHVHDVAAELDNEFPDSREPQLATGARTILATPLVREGLPIVVINIRRTKVRPFSDKHIK